MPLEVLHFVEFPSIDTIALGSWRAHTSDAYLLFEEEEAVVAENLSVLQLFVSLNYTSKSKVVIFLHLEIINL